MQDPEAGLAFAEPPKRLSYLMLWAIFLLVLLVALGMAQFRLTAMEAVN
jgi:hypothetical protein